MGEKKVFLNGFPCDVCSSGVEKYGEGRDGCAGDDL